MRANCLICGVDFAVTPEAICILCESKGLGVCVRCSEYSHGGIYCPACRENMAGESYEYEEDEEYGEYEKDGEEEEEFYYEEV